MKQNINFNQFVDSFSESYKNNFSYEGKRALFDYLEQYEEDSDTEIECDIIALCCKYTEYEGVEEYINYYTPDIKKDDFFEDDGKVFDKEAYFEAIEEYIEEHTTLIKLSNDLDDGFIIQAY